MVVVRQICLMAGIFFLGSPCLRCFSCLAFRFPSSAPATPSSFRTQPRRRQLVSTTTAKTTTTTSLAALDQLAVDLILQTAATAIPSHPQLSVLSSHLLLGTDATLHAMATVMDPADLQGDEISSAVAASASSASTPLSPAATIAVFVAGVVPFAVATVEFWRRIALRLPFGTGAKDESVLIVIGDDNNPQLSRGRRVLGKDALAVAIILFAVAAAVLGLAVVSVVTSAPPPPSHSY